MSHALFFEEEVSKMVFVRLYDVNFVMYLASATSINDPFCKKSNASFITMRPVSKNKIMHPSTSIKKKIRPHVSDTPFKTKLYPQKSAKSILMLMTSKECVNMVKN